MNFKSAFVTKTFTDTYFKRDINKNASNDIMIIGIDDKSLNEIGKWPFKRSVHSKIIDYFTNSEYRENLLFFDIFFLEDDYNPQEDTILTESMKRNGNVILDYIAHEKDYIDKDEEIEMQKRINFIKDKFGLINNIKGPLQNAAQYMGLTPPTIKYMENVSQVGCANIKTKEDKDEVLRRYPLVFKYIDREEVLFNELKNNNHRVDKIYLLSHTILYNKRLKEYRIERREYNIFDITGVKYSERKHLSEDDLDKIRKSIINIESNFKDELKNIRERIENNNKLVVSKIEKYFLKNKTQKDFEDQILSIIKNEEYFKDIDLIIKNIINQLTKTDNKLKKEKKFLKKMYKKLIKIKGWEEARIDKNKQVEQVNLYDFLYNNKKVNFNKLLIFKESFFISIPLVLLSKYYNVEVNDIEVIFGKEILLKNPKVYNSDKKHFEKLKVNNKALDFITIPIDKSGNLLINYIGPRSSTNRNEKKTYEAYSYFDFISGKQILIKDKIAMVGAYAEGVAYDEYLTPFGNMYGIEIIANTINTVIKRNYIKKLNSYLYLFILFVFSIIIALISSNKMILRAYIYSILFIFLYYLFATLLFINTNVVLEVPKIIIISILSLMSVIVYRVLTEERQKKKIKEIFSRYVNPSVVEELLESPPELGGVDKNITVFFSDIRDFTTLSERLPPQKIITHLNTYFTAMTDIIFKYNGTLDKYVGDEIMCFWGAPKPQENHAELACKAALEQIKKLKELNKKWDKKMRMNIGIGINTGIMTVGNVGSEGRMNYTIIGDNVNLGARLEGVNKTFGTNIIVSETTYQLVKDKFIFKELDTIRVKGKEKPVKIYELIEVKK